MLTLPHYQVDRQIYENTNSLLYRGVRKKDNKPVILKMLKEDYPTPAELTRYRQEYEIIHDLNLAGVIKAYEIEKYQNTLVMILEDFGGDSLKQLIANHPLTVEAFLPLAIQIAESLGNIHAANIIHKDINPSNLVWEPINKQLKIIDFGIASRLPRENLNLKSPEQLEGTLAYLSPEQSGRINRSLDYRTDLYSLGVTFYELLTGFLPFTTSDAMELVHCHIAKIPLSVFEFNSNVPPILSNIIMKLMAKNAEERYQSAFGVKADLEQLQCQFAKSTQIESFQIAQNDFSGKLQIPEKLYGRENEVNTLLQAFERVSRGAKEMMLVAGYSGVGKTALVREVHKPMTSRRGYFAAGKFDPFQKNIPYSAMTQAFNEFCRYLLMESAETLANWRTKILKALSNNGQIIINVIPDLELIIGTQPSVAEVGPTEAQNRFQMFFLNFVKALCNKDHPFILFIDDLQWVDSASLALLKSIMLDDEIKYLFIIGAYRDNEVDSTHPFIIAASELEKANAIINTLELTNLLSNDINQLLQESLKYESALTQPLTDLIYQKTQGNAFFTHQFLHTLYFEGLLHFDFKQHQWQWDVEQIAAQNITANVVELMANKINKLPSNTAKLLQLAACIGNQFDLSLLAIIDEQDQKETLSVLWDAIKEGFIQPLDENYKRLELDQKVSFKFLHDRIQQAAYAGIEDQLKQAIHLQIGHLLLKKTPDKALGEKIFEIVGQFNPSFELLNHPAERLKVAQLNLKAGQKAKAATAYDAAVSYLKTGLKGLPSDSWENQYELTLALYVETVEAEYLNLHFDNAEKLAKIVLQQAHSLLEKVRIYEKQIQFYSAHNQFQTAMDTTLQVLEMLGISLCDSPPEEMTIEALSQLPNLTNPSQLAAMRILMIVWGAAILVTPKLLPKMAFTMLHICINSGNSPLSAFSYAFYGFNLCNAPENIDKGYQFGQLALTFLTQFETRETKCRVYHIFNAFIRHWKEPASHTIEPLYETIQIGLENGDLEYTCYAAMQYSCYAFLVGQPLDSVNQKHHYSMTLIRHLKQEFQLLYVQLWAQLAHHFTNPTADKQQLIGEFFDETQITESGTSLYCLYLAKTILNYFFHNFEQAIENALKAEDYEATISVLLPRGQIPFYSSLSLLAVYLTTEPHEQMRTLQKVNLNQQRLKMWAEQAPTNYQHKYDLVEAEKARVLGENWQAAERYEKAIAGAKENGYLHEEALAYELAAEFYLAQSMTKFARTDLIEAHYCYQQWNALAKVEDLETRYPQFLARKTADTVPTTDATILARHMASTSTKNASEWLDLNSIMKAAQTLSGEIVLSRLLQKMMHIVIENAGASVGFLLLPQNDKWFIEALGCMNSDDVSVLQSHPVENKQIAQSLIHYVVRTQEHVVLNNASIEGQFIRDPYIVKQRPKSILCVPLVNQGKLTGILYLENNLTTGAFTPDRLEVLQVLSSQLAISIENALLYRTLEQKVDKRTAQLAQANKEITVLNKQLKSDNLRMSAELAVSRQLQQMLLPSEKELQAIDGLELAGFMEPADEVGGDYYDVLQHNGRILFGIGDVTGHGLESGALAIMVQSSIRTLLANNETDPVQFFSALNQMVFHNVQRMNVGKSLTLALVNYQDKQLYLSGQHEEVIVVRQGKLELIDTIDLGFPIGLDQEIASFVAQIKVPLNPGDVVVLYTDGITEAENGEGVLYGLERLCDVIRENWQQRAQELKRLVIDDVHQFIGQQKVFDDMTLLVLKQK